MDLRDQLQRTLGDAYSLERELGGGGMSRVFVATEAALGRRVVVKVVPGASAGSVSIDRFKREIHLGIRAYALAKAGQTAEAKRIADQLAVSAATVPAAAVGATFAHLGLGDIDAAIVLAISAARRGTASYLATPDFDPLRTHRRYPELLRALGLHDQPIAQWQGRAPVVDAECGVM